MKNRIDKILIAAIIILSIFGIIMIYSASSIWAEYKFNDFFLDWYNYHVCSI